MTGLKKKSLQIYLREDQLITLRRVAERRGETLAALIREGVDMLLEELPTGEDPLLDILDLYDSGKEDLAEKHDDYLVDLITEEGNHEA